METTERTKEHGEPIQAWSEEIPDFLCSVCEKDGQTYKAVTYCTICCEFMCTRSLNDHNKFSPNKSHKLLGKSEMKAHRKSLTLSIQHGSDDVGNSLSYSIQHGSDTMDSLSQSILSGSDAMASSFSDSNQQEINAVYNSYERCKELEGRLEECQDELHQKKTELDNQRREYEYSTQRCSDLIVDMTDMKTCKDDLQKKLEQSQDRADTQAKEDKERYDKLESEHKEIKHKLYAMSTELDIQRRANESWKRKQDLTEKQRVELEQKMKEMTSHEKQLQAYIKDEKDGRVKVNDTLKEAQLNLELNNSELEHLRTEIERLGEHVAGNDGSDRPVQTADTPCFDQEINDTLRTTTTNKPDYTTDSKKYPNKITQSSERTSEMEMPNIQPSPSPHQRHQQQPTPFVKVIRKVDTEDICLQRFTTHTRTSPAKYCSTSPVQYKQFQSFDKTLSRYQEKHGEPIMVSISIFFGAITSRCTFSYNTDVFKVTPLIWRNREGLHVTTRALTFALIQPDGETLHSFGYDALVKYEELKEEGICNDWYFFKGFDPLLFSQSDIRSSTLVEDINGRKYPLGKVISLCITFLHDHIWEEMNSKVTKTIHSDVRWVLVIPDICSTATAQIIVTAAETCLHGCMVSINEAEATLFSCDSRPSKMYVMEEKWDKHRRKSTYDASYVDKWEFSMDELEIGTKYIVLNLEEELAICSVHEIMRGQVIRRTGTGYVMLDIDNVVKKFWENICGPEVMQSLKEDHPDEYTDLTLTTRVRLMKLACRGDERMHIYYNIGLENLLFEKEGKIFKQAVEESIYAGQIIVRRQGLIRVEKHVFVEILQTYYNNLADIALDFVRHEAVQNDSAIVMTGEQLNCDMMVKIMRKKFARARLYFDEDYSETGPALYGHVSIR